MLDQANNITTHPQLARIHRLIEDHEYERASQALINFLRSNPQSAEAHALIGHCAMRLGALMQAEQFLRRAIALGARSFDVRRDLASVLGQQDRPMLALPFYEALIEERDDARMRGSHAAIVEKIGESERARMLLATLTRDFPDNPQVWVSAGHNHRSAGRVEEAIEAYRTAIEQVEDYGEAWWGLASIKRTILTDEDIDRLRAALAEVADERNEAPLNFALARAYHDRKQFAEAFDHYAKGNAIRAESLKYDPLELHQEISETIQSFDASVLSQFPTEPVGNDHPIFIVSLPRSGSTLLEQMLGSHPEIEPVGELSYIPAILRSFMEMATRRQRITVPQAIMSMPENLARTLGQDYLDRARIHRKTGKRFFVDKLPHNWSNVLFIKRILPEARFIDIRRAAMDCCFSNFTQSFTSAHASSFSLDHIGHSYADYVRLMNHFDSVTPSLVQNMSYARLLDDPRAELSGVFDYLGLPWDDSVLEFHKLDRVVRTPSSEQVRRPLNRDGMEVWRPYSQWLGPLREALGELTKS